MTFFLKQIQFSFLIHCILSNYSLANVAGVLGPFDCMAFLFTIVHKVCLTLDISMKTPERENRHRFDQGHESVRVWCHVQQLLRVNN